MEEKEEIPKTAKKFYDKLVALNTNKKLKINKKFSKIYYDFISVRKDEHPPYRVSPTEDFKSQDLKNKVMAYLIASIKEINDRKKKYFIFIGECSNCGNKLIYTGGFSRTRSLRGLMHGMFCLNCGKSFLWRPNLIEVI